MTVYGYDVSHYRVPNHAQARTQGYEFAWCKATDGATSVDPTYHTQIASIKSAGLVPGAFHFLESGNGTGQADHFLATIGNPEGLLCALDVEAGSWSDVVAFVTRFKAATGGHRLFIYSGNWYWNTSSFGNPSAASLGCPLWDSRYLTAGGSAASLYPTVPSSWWASRYGGWPAVSMLQFSDKGTIGNLTGDIDAWRGTLAELKAYAYKPVVGPAPLSAADAAKLEKQLDRLYHLVVWNCEPGAAPGSHGPSWPSLWGLRSNVQGAIKPPA